MTTSEAERSAMRRALVLAATPGVPLGPNPRVGCVLIDDDGATVAEGHHGGAGTPHAEADALARAGARAAGTTAVVTLEPCNHTGRTAPCAQALVAAGVRRVVFAQADPNPAAAGGGTSRWVSSRAARLDTHRLRALCDVMLVGSNTVAVDDPLLTVRDEDDRPLPQQPLRSVMGERDLDAGRRVFNGDAESLHLRTRDPEKALAEL